MSISVVYWSGTGNTQAMAEAIGEGIEENGGDIGIDPCLHIIFYMESAIQQLIAEYLLGGGKAGQQDPAQQGQGKQNPQGKNQVSGGKL